MFVFQLFWNISKKKIVKTYFSSFLGKFLFSTVLDFLKNKISANVNPFSGFAYSGYFSDEAFTLNLKFTKMKRTKLMLPALLLGVALGFSSCSNDDDTNAGTSKMEVRLTDAPGDYSQVLID